MSDVEDALRRIDAGTPEDRDAMTLAAEVRRLRAELLEAREATTDDAMDHLTDLFPTSSAKRLAAKRAGQRDPADGRGT